MKPLFIWAGGKNKMLKHYKSLMPENVSTYCEPFFGGGAMYIHVVNHYNPKHLIINDINEDIVRIYKTIKTDFQSFTLLMDEMSKEYEGKAVIGKVNVDLNSTVSAQFNVRSIPTVLFIKNGEVVDKSVGAVPKANLVSKLEALL
jgi:site-specific DNA-adenine methylase